MNDLDSMLRDINEIRDKIDKAPAIYKTLLIVKYLNKLDTLEENFFNKAYQNIHRDRYGQCHRVITWETQELQRKINELEEKRKRVSSPVEKYEYSKQIYNLRMEYLELEEKLIIENIAREASLPRSPEGIPYCFVKGTLVYTSEGYKKIEEIEIGDLVYSYNGEETELKLVTNTFVNQTNKILTIESADTSIEVTEGHYFYIDGNWVLASSLEIGKNLTTIEGNIPIDNITSREEDTEVYNFTVADNHNYYVSKKKVLVHNDSNLL